MLSTIVALLALSIGGVIWLVSHQGLPTATTTTATLQVIQSGKLTWKQVMVPKGFPGADQYPKGGSDASSSVVVAHHNGAVAYACQADRKKVSYPVVWATRDTGASWSVITPSNLPAGIGGCRIILDDNNAQTLVVSFYPFVNSSSPASPDQWITYASFDSGKTWRRPTGLQDESIVYALASSHGRIYALRASSAQESLYVSSDNMQHWTQIDANVPKSSSIPSQPREAKEMVALWVNPATDEVLVQVRSMVLWSTRDDGVHWEEIPYPSKVLVGAPNGPAFVVGFPGAYAYPVICGVFTPILSDGKQRIKCSTDDGQTWTDRSAPSDSSLGVPSLVNIDIGYDGSIIAIGFGNSKGTNFAFYRLAPDARTDNSWQRLGVIPNSGLSAHYQVTPSGVAIVFWNFPASSTANGQSITQPNYYVAIYR
ncbi:MAG TPA: hypothetical protein VFW76_05225 [Ktedonobacterales bacterium]|nr:hypothetical protein [Ktedonobacterales bacterium]